MFRSSTKKWAAMVHEAAAGLGTASGAWLGAGSRSRRSILRRNGRSARPARDAGGAQHLAAAPPVPHPAYTSSAGAAARVRLAVAEPRVGEHAPAGRRGQTFGDVAPQRDAAQSLVQQHQRWGLGRARPPPGGFQRPPSSWDGDPARIIPPAAGSAGSCLSRSSAGRRRNRSIADISRRRRGLSRGPASSGTSAA